MIFGSLARRGGRKEKYLLLFWWCGDGVHGVGRRAVVLLSRARASWADPCPGPGGNYARRDSTSRGERRRWAPTQQDLEGVL